MLSHEIVRIIQRDREREIEARLRLNAYKRALAIENDAVDGRPRRSREAGIGLALGSAERSR